MTQNQDNNAYDFTMLLMVASRVVIAQVQERLNELGFDDVRPAHGFAFLRLSHGGTTGQDLAEYLGISKQASSQMIDYLEQRGYIRRQPLPGDARNKVALLTDKGWQCIQATETILRGFQSQWTALLGPARFETLHEDLHRLILDLNGGVLPNKLRPLDL